MKKQMNKYALVLLTAFFGFGMINAQTQDEIIGKWDLEVLKDDKVYPSWLEVKLSGVKTLVGFFVKKYIPP